VNGTHGPGSTPGPEQQGGRLAPYMREPDGRLRRGLGYLRRHWFIALATLVVLLVLAVRFLRPPAGASDANVPAVVNAGTGVARIGDFAVGVNVLGTVEPRPGAFAQVAAPAASRVARILVATGDRVAAGQPLVELDESVWVLQARQAQIALDAAQQAYDRASRLFQQGISPRKDVESSAADLARAKADLESARRTEALGTLRSPIAGVVTELNAALSQPVNENQPLVEVVNPAGLEVLFHLSPSDAARIAPGGEVELSSARDSAHTFLGRGRITGVSAAVDSATGSVAVRATIGSPTQALRAGETVAGKLVYAVRRRVVIVPVGALVPVGQALQVFVVDARGIAHATPVTVGARSDTEAEITSGLRGGETVVTAGAYGVTDSAHVVPPGQTENAPAGGAGA